MDVDKLLDRESKIAREQQSTVMCSVELVIRYLGEHDHVVFSDRKGGYLMNGKFHLGPSEIVATANRIRRRQRQPQFELSEV